MEQNRKLEVMVGIFMLIMFFMLAWVVLSLGKQKGYVGENFEIHAYFRNIKGLSKDKSVYLYGKYIGSVSNIQFPESPKDERIKVTFSIRKPYLQFIKKDAVAKITTQSILGSKSVDISPGKENIVIKDGDFIMGYVSADPIKAVETAGEVLIKTKTILDTIGDMVKNYKNSDLLSYLLYVSQFIKKTTDAIDNQEGILGTVIFDENNKKQLIETVKNLNATSKNLKDLSSSLLRITKEIENNENSLTHQLIYGSDGKKIMASLALVSSDSAKISNEIINGKNLLHNFIFEKSEIKDSLTDSAIKLNKVITSIYEGKGSLGAIIMDPTIYEDLKGVFGKIKSNQVLKSLIRFSIQREEK
jgi:phospholipid/cholesterol/gamma-HCH transport system substrate-binding protein